MARPQNIEKKVNMSVRITEAAKNYLGKDASIILEQEATKRMGHAMSLDEAKLKIEGNLTNIQAILLEVKNRPLTDEERTSIQQSLARLRQLGAGLEGEAICRRNGGL